MNTLRTHVNATHQFRGVRCRKLGRECCMGWRSRTDIIINYVAPSVYIGSIVQTAVTLSSTEAEYIALSEPSSKMSWFRQVLNRLEVSQAPTEVYRDSVRAIKWAQGERQITFRAESTSPTDTISYWIWSTEGALYWRSFLPRPWITISQQIFLVPLPSKRHYRSRRYWKSA